MKQVSVIILNWNGEQLLRRYLPSVVAHTDAAVADIIVADNGSTDTSLDMLRADFPEVKTLPLGHNYGFAEGYNRAIASVGTPYVVLLNDDVRVTPRWLDPLVAYMEEHPDVAACQPKLLSDREPDRFEYAGASGGYLDRLGYPYCRGRIFQTVEADAGQYDAPRPVMWATGACLLVRTELYRRAGGLDARFFAHMEEVDLCWRLRRMGYTLMCLPASAVHHLGGGSLAMGHPRKTLLNFRNSLLMLWKNLPASERRRTLRRRKLLDGVAALNFALHFEWAHVRAIWQSHREFDRMRRSEYAGDQPLLSSDGLFAVAPAMREGSISILWQYYVRRRHTFSQIEAHLPDGR